MEERDQELEVREKCRLLPTHYQRSTTHSLPFGEELGTTE
jgi:hypothetical protein